MSLIRIDYRRVSHFKMVLITSCLSTLLVSTVVYFNPANYGWWNLPEFSWLNLLQFIFIDQMLIECLTVSIILTSLKKYGETLNLTKLDPTPYGILRYELLFLPIPFLAFFLFNPFTQTARYLYHYFPHFDRSVYFMEYFYSVELYLAYLPISFLQVYAVLNYNFLRQIGSKEISSDLESKHRFLEVSSDKGKKLLDKKEIIFCQKKERKYWIHTNTSSFTTPMTISQLESILPPDKFVRINRSTIVKIEAINSYSFWENDKYVVRVIGDWEFIMSRKRLRSIKEKLGIV